ncbi:MAG: hypothetical protein IJI47_01720 [Eubacterium sp.]|nr:hypothetical protein [Eubacterium sp.]
MRQHKRFLRIFAFLLAVCMVISGQPWTAAAAQAKQDSENAKLYMSEVKVFYGRILLLRAVMSCSVKLI